MTATLNARVPLAMRLNGQPAHEARTVAAIPTNTPGLFVAWSKERGTYQIVHSSGLVLAHGWDRAQYAIWAAEDDPIAHAVDWTTAPRTLHEASYRTVHGIAAAIKQHGGTFLHTLAA